MSRMSTLAFKVMKSFLAVKLDVLTPAASFKSSLLA